MTIPKPKIAIEYFSSSPSPAIRPNANQYRPSRLIARIAKYAQPIHRRGSKLLVVSRLPAER